MSIGNFRLLYAGVELGHIVETNADFPGFGGTWTPSPAVDHAELRDRIQKYVEFSERVDSLMADDDVTPASEAYCDENEAAFQDLIESEDWALQDSHSNKAAILVPIFHTGRQISWRYSPNTAV